MNAATLAGWVLRDFELYIVSRQAATSSTAQQSGGSGGRSAAVDEKTDDGDGGGGGGGEGGGAGEAGLAAAAAGLTLDDDDIPNELICPITMELMTEPVIAADGHSYEKAAIEEWLKDHTL